MTSKISQEFKEKIRAKIAELEKQTCLEVVPVVAYASSDYQGIRSSLALGTGFIAYATLTFAHFSTPTYCLLASVVFAALMAVILTRPAVLRRVIPKKIILFEVENAAHLSFLQEEVFATHFRTGILIYISELERAVYVLADRGVSAKEPPETWIQLGAQLAKDFQKQSAGETFLEAIQALSDRLAKDFPPLEEDQSEKLSIEVREERGPIH